jgi:hypothetical protein
MSPLPQGEREAFLTFDFFFCLNALHNYEVSDPRFVMCFKHCA